jgi:hypothetical protein
MRYLPINVATMFRRALAACLILGLAGSFSAPAAPTPAAPHMTAKQIVAKNVKARGGLDAWRKIDTMVSIGQLQTGNPSMPNVPFVMQQARPNKTRFEIHVREKTSVRVFNGVEGWKLNQSPSASAEAVPYTAEEIAAARDGLGIDGPLIDYQAKGIGVDFDGIDEVAGRKAYRLKVKLPSGAIRRWWIDAATFLDLKYERESRTSTGQPATVTVSFANYKSVDGLLIAHSIITGQDSGSGKEAMLIEQAFFNRPLGDKIFSQPRAPARLKSASSLPAAR